MRYIGIIILLVLCLTLLLLTGCKVNTGIPETAIGNLENQENTEEPVKWPGLGMGLYHSQASYIDTILANGFEELRIDIPDYQNTIWLNNSKATVIGAITKGAKVIWGVSSNKNNNKDYSITAANWPTYRQAILDNALWAQNNGVYEFQLGNELEGSIDEDTLTITQLIANLKSLATEVQEIFTNGNVSYTCWQHQLDSLDPWIAAGSLGDIDILACNIYKGGQQDPDYDLTYQNRIAQLVTAFGAEHTYLTEFNVSYTALEHYSEDEAVQAAALTEMIDYIKASGMTRAFYFMWKDDGAATFGVVKADGTYRLLWNQALLNSGSVKSITVPTKTATISLPATIALIHE